MINHLVNQRYEVLEKVGDSALFAVYKARDRVANRVVALKTALPPYDSDARFVEGLQSGLTTTVGLDHPNITHFYEFGQEEGTPYAVVEFVRGINLKERIRRIAPFTLSVAIDFACSITEALAYAHSLGQMHGDLRPHNVIISPEGAVKVTDFGIQKAVSRSTAAQRETLLRAAPYHAPELSTTQPGTVGGDIYALGTILYEMLTGTPLYAGDTPEKIADQHAFSPIPSPRLLNPGVPRSIEGIIIKCLQKRPEARYRTAAELLTDLKSVRDALRFGKPLSWSPIELDSSVDSVPSVRRIPEPVVEVAATHQVIAMPATNNRLRAESERVSIYIRALIVTMTILIVVTLIGFLGIWSTMWVVPKALTLPQMIGKPIDEVRRMTDEMKVKRIEHAEYSDRPRNIVYKTDPKDGASTRQNHVINIWYSRGPEYVDVPNLVGLSKDAAEQKLKDIGLVLGKVIPEYSNSVPFNGVIRQTVSYKKRVFHDTPVDLVISDGRKPDYAAVENTEPPPTTDTNPTPPNPDNNTDTNTPVPNNDNITAPGETEIHEFNRTISIPQDKKGQRQVRIEYVDSSKTPISMINEPHNEGDKIPLSFTYTGKNITLTIYYDDKKVWEKTFDPQATKNERIR